MSLLKQNNKNSSNEEQKPLNTWEEIEGTPFHVITTVLEDTNEEEYRLALGRQLMSMNVWETKKEVIEYVEEKPWALLEQYILTVNWMAIKDHEIEEHNNKITKQ